MRKPLKHITYTLRDDVRAMVTDVLNPNQGYYDVDTITTKVFDHIGTQSATNRLDMSVSDLWQLIHDNDLRTAPLVATRTVLTRMLDSNDRVEVNDTAWLRIDDRPAYRTDITFTAYAHPDADQNRYANFVVDAVDFGEPTPTIVIAKDEGRAWDEDPARAILFESDDTMNMLAKLAELLA